MTTVETPPATAGFTRYAMITCAVVAPLALALSLLFAPNDATAEGEAYIRSFVANLDGYALWSWISALSFAAFIPGIFGVGKVARSGRPVLGLVGMVLAFILALPVSLDTDGVIYAAAKIGLDVPTTNRLVTELNEGLPTSVLGFSFFLGLLGFVLLGIAALRSAAPKWAAIAMIVAPFLIPIAWFAQLGNLVAGAAWLVFAAASGGIALVLPADPRRT
ncbi:hypothetical protein [Nonomuraea basaltis]|uniref:hypothetical protein n=1 Tax=Nonomuraea basaltis TaxID=2495887 RepID=UPI00110C6661|nr:hypothetical protein [Nonomuraea basaltis]TMR88443.1 hypothetical protein EJK15_66215 [Nonomuraea basaltis]